MGNDEAKEFEVYKNHKIRALRFRLEKDLKGRTIKEAEQALSGNKLKEEMEFFLGKEFLNNCSPTEVVEKLKIESLKKGKVYSIEDVITRAFMADNIKKWKQKKLFWPFKNKDKVMKWRFENFVVTMDKQGEFSLFVGRCPILLEERHQSRLKDLGHKLLVRNMRGKQKKIIEQVFGKNVKISL